MIRSFYTDRRGSVAAAVGLVFGLTALAAGGAVDYTLATNKRHAMQDAADAAVLAAASLQSASESERIDSARKMFLGSTFCEQQTCRSLQIGMAGGAIEFKGSAEVKTSLLQIVGISDVEVAVTSRALPVQELPLDVVMVLDYSGSMGHDNKYQDMAAAATQFIEKVDQQPGDTISIGVAPFSKYVLTPMEGRYLYDVTIDNNLSGQTVVGCVLNREYPHSTNADEPSVAAEGSLWPVLSYATGSAPGTASNYSDTFDGALEYQSQRIYLNHYAGGTVDYTLEYFDTDPSSTAGNYTHEFVQLSDGTWQYQFDGKDRFHMKVTPHNTTPPAALFNNPPEPQVGDFPEYAGFAGSSNWVIGDDTGLPASFDQDTLTEDLSGPCTEYATKNLWVRPLSQNFSQLTTAIGSMRPIGYTNIALGLDLGWHMLTPDAPFTEVHQGDGVQKVAILLTDGRQTVRAHGPGNRVSRRAANANIAESCAGMKADGIEVFTIAFDIDDAYTRDLLKNCASSEPHYFEPAAGGDLDEVFAGIFEKVTNGRVRLSH